MDVKADGETLTLEDVAAVARDNAKAVVPRDARSRISQSRRTLEGILKAGGTVHGVNTGCGVLADTPVNEDEGLELQRRIVRSHAAGVGDPLRPSGRPCSFASTHSPRATRPSGRNWSTTSYACSTGASPPW